MRDRRNGSESWSEGESVAFSIDGRTLFELARAKKMMRNYHGK